MGVQHFQVQDEDSGNPAWVVTPGGAWCRFMFLSGALTEVAEIGDMVRTRIADPTGVFNLVIGGRNTALAETFCKLPCARICYGHRASPDVPEEWGSYALRSP